LSEAEARTFWVCFSQRSGFAYSLAGDFYQPKAVNESKINTLARPGWSGLSPVFLDDPVTHFDDLNTYAFLDLIVGLLESDIGRRQFIISTCDEKFLQLSQQKFRYLGKGAKFYHFSAISAEGPVVTEIASQS
jgi:hypothetical protein